MSLREVVRTLRFERRRALGIAASIVEQQGDKHRRKGSRNDKD